MSEAAPASTMEASHGTPVQNSNNCHNHNYSNIAGANSELTFSPERSQPQSTARHKVSSSSRTRTRSRSPSLPALLRCGFVIILTASSLVALAHGGDPSARPHPRRLARSTIYANDYSSSAPAPAPLPSGANKGDKNSRERYLAGLGLRTRHQPQQFYSREHEPSSTRAPEPTTGAAGAGGRRLNELASWNLVAGAREDICKEHCACAKVKNAFTTITCDFQQNRQLSAVFGTNFRVPEDATSITIKLAANTNFRLERGFFSNNKVNSLSIEGTYGEREQVEITTEAFRGNFGPYPEIYMTNVFSVVIRAKAFSGNCKFSVRNSNDLILFPDAFQNASINGLLVAINDLRIEEKAFNSAQAKLRIESSHIDNIYRFEASLREIRFVNCSIGTINGGTFDVITINSIVFESCRIDVIKARAITEKLYSEHVSITGAIIGTIESEAIYGSGIAELILTKNKIDSIHENAIHVTAINATITQNNVKHLGHHWLSVKDWSSIVVSRNQFGVFGSMFLEETKQPVTCRFESNSLTQPLPGSLNITNRYCVLREISVNIPCRCHLGWLHELSARDLRSETYCTIDDKLGFCFNATSFNTLKYLNEVCDETKTTLDCVKNMNLKKINGVFFTPEELERRDQHIPKLIFIVGGGVVLVLLAMVVVFVAYQYCRGPPGGVRRGDGGGGSSNGSTMPKVGDHLHEFSLADRHVIDQTLQVVQKKHPDIHKQINEHVQALLQRNLPDKKCVKRISHIVELLNQVEHPGDDFIAFNRVLTQHLQPQVPTAPPADPIYAEPGLGLGLGLGGGPDDGFYTSSAVRPAAHGGPGAESMTNLPEHIYAEPHCAQQPLLRNEYASPADGHIESMDLYTEPINERDTNPPTTQRPPQYATPIRHQKLPVIPSAAPAQKSQNLPDVLYQSSPSSAVAGAPPSARPLTNVQRMAQDLQNMPKFHINTLTPNASRRHLHLVAPPVYATPEAEACRRTPFSRSTGARLATPEFDECDMGPGAGPDLGMDMRGAAALPLDSGSNHSGGSNETVKIDDVIQYADA